MGWSGHDLPTKGWQLFTRGGDKWGLYSEV